MMQPYDPITDVNTFADRLKQAREAAGLNQTQLAEKSGVGQSAISMYERGMRKRSKEIVSLAGALNVDARWLETGHGSRTLQTELKAQEVAIESHWPADTPHLGVAQRLILDGQTVLILSRDQVMSEVDQDLFAYAVPDEAVEGQLERGALVVWQRSRAPRFGRPVLVRVGDELHVRLYEQGRAPGQWIARATRAGFASFDSSTDQAVIVAALRGMLEPD